MNGDSCGLIQSIVERKVYISCPIMPVHCPTPVSDSVSALGENCLPKMQQTFMPIDLRYVHSFR